MLGPMRIPPLVPARADGDALIPGPVRRAAAWSWLAHALCLFVAERTGARLEGYGPALLALAVAAAASVLLALRTGRAPGVSTGAVALVLLPALWSGGFLYSYTQPHERMLTTQFLVLCLLAAAPFAVRRAALARRSVRA